MGAKKYPTILQAIHLIILYIFIQAVVDFPLALIDYYNGTEHLYHPIKKVLLGVGSTLFILWFGFKNTGHRFSEVFPYNRFNPLIILLLISFFTGTHQLLNGVNMFVERIIPTPMWFWELFSNIFDSDFGFFGAFMKVVIVAPVVEELIFRGVIMHGLMRNYSKAKAVFFSGLLFALFHLNPWQFPATFVLGILLGWIMIYTRNIYLAIAGHALNNLMVLLAITYHEQLNNLVYQNIGAMALNIIAAIITSASIVGIYLIFKKGSS